MISILIDTSLSYIRLGLYENEKLIDHVDEFCDKDLSKLFIKRVRELLLNNNISINNIDKIFAVTGPGSFTGIRIGLTFAKILGMSVKKDRIPISELEILASTKTETKYIVPIIDARRGYVYTGLYDNDIKNIIEDKYLNMEDFLEKLNEKDVTFVSFDEFDNIKITKPNIDYETIIEKFKNRETINYHSLNPNYLKNTEAEENLKKKMLNDN